VHAWSPGGREPVAEPDTPLRRRRCAATCCRPGWSGRLLRRSMRYRQHGLTVQAVLEAGKQGRRESGEPVTLVVSLDGILRLAPRRSEHVGCAHGRDVLAAGEVAFALTGDVWSVRDATNQSTGYCPDLDSWPAVADALNRAGIGCLDDYTDPVVFRRCVSCGERNIVRDDGFTCALCGHALLLEWNFADG
jgi:hypothetical protein